MYLCGSIVKNPLSMAWRDFVYDELTSRNVLVLDPCRGKTVEDLDANGFDCPGPMQGGGFVYRDLIDIKASQVLLMMWWGDPGRQSIGTWWELGYANALGKTLVIADPNYQIADHPFVAQLASQVYVGPEALPRAVDFVEAILK